MSDKKQSYAARAHWVKKWNENPSLGKYRGNVHRDAAQLRPIIDDIGYDEVKRLIDFYFKINVKPDLMWFLYNYDRLLNELERIEEDRRHREQLREATRRRMEELQLGQNPS